MTEIYLHFLCTHYGLYGNAPVDADDAVAATSVLSLTLAAANDDVDDDSGGGGGWAVSSPSSRPQPSAACGLLPPQQDSNPPEPLPRPSPRRNALRRLGSFAFIFSSANFLARRYCDSVFSSTCSSSSRRKPCTSGHKYSMFLRQ